MKDERITAIQKHNFQKVLVFEKYLFKKNVKKLCDSALLNTLKNKISKISLHIVLEKLVDMILKL